ncbi:MAG: type II toxin-antitoxin system HipA family toxin [Gemmatimonadota bacterium]|nr:type II toxin-antitoxin system HipA family toxin [Gemmatimonadota bacterium]
MRKLEVRLDWGEKQVRVGVLAEQDRRIYFEYDAAFLENPLPISPIKLPARPGVFEHTERDFAAVFGVFNDSLPDGWGLLLMDREFRKRGMSPAAVSVLDRLAYIGTRGLGALTYHPPTGVGGEASIRIELEALARQAARILEGSAEDVLPALRIAGGSPGGARPKVIVGLRDDGHMISGTSDLPEGYRHILVKFPATEDPPDIGAVEEAFARMARAGGVDVPPSRLIETRGGGRYFAAERFDRQEGRRLHMHTLGGLLHASHRLPSLEYEGLLKATLVLTKDQRQVDEAFRRMVFNVLAHNRDDHVKNFSYLMDRTGRWRLSPAYDLVFAEGPGGQHTMAIAGEAERPGEEDMLHVAESCGVDRRRAREIVKEIQAAVAQWPDLARDTGVSARTRRHIERAFNRQAMRRGRI